MTFGRLQRELDESRFSHFSLIVCKHRRDRSPDCSKYWVKSLKLSVLYVKHRFTSAKCTRGLALKLCNCVKSSFGTKSRRSFFVEKLTRYVLRPEAFVRKKLRFWFTSSFLQDRKYVDILAFELCNSVTISFTTKRHKSFFVDNSTCNNLYSKVFSQQAPFSYRSFQKYVF